MGLFKKIINIAFADKSEKQYPITITADTDKEAEETRKYLEQEANAPASATLQRNQQRDYEYRMMHGNNKGDAPGYD